MANNYVSYLIYFLGFSSQKNILIFSDYKEDNFLSGNVKKIELEHRTQKEGLCFKDNYTLLITDEKAHGVGGNLYELKVN